MTDRNSTTVNPPLGGKKVRREGTGHIIVRLAKRNTHNTHDLRELAARERYSNLAAFLETNGHLRAERLIRHISPDRLRELENHCLDGEFASLETLTAYWRIDVRNEDNAEKHRAALESFPEVALAYHETSVSNACPDVVGAAQNPYLQYQGFLDGAPEGIGATAAWAECQCGGEGVKVIDLESGWILSHEDLPKPQLLYGDDGSAEGEKIADHGAAAMGVVGAINNKKGVIGVAPNIFSLNAVSHFDAPKGTELHVADAIVAALCHLDEGDILLLEVQRYIGQDAYPTEIDSADLHAIRLAACHGIIVIEPAANGSLNLDNWTDPAGEHSLDVNDPKHIESGAIMTGAASSNVLTDASGNKGHKRYYTSNYGNRVNVYAWGEFIFSAGYGDIAGAEGSNGSYTANFGQTSGASAIIAGAAALVQSWKKNAGGSPLAPLAMRETLTNPATATPQVPVDGEPIGVMPDVSAIVSASP